MFIVENPSWLNQILPCSYICKDNSDVYILFYVLVIYMLVIWGKMLNFLRFDLVNGQRERERGYSGLVFEPEEAHVNELRHWQRGTTSFRFLHILVGCRVEERENKLLINFLFRQIFSRKLRLIKVIYLIFLTNFIFFNLQIKYNES